MIEPIGQIRKVPNEGKTFVYFVRSGEFIKIGQSLRWKKRIEQMQVGSPHTIITLLVMIADPKLEHKLHNRFRADHFRGEWFRSGPAVLAYIKEHLKECVTKTGQQDLRPGNWEDAFPEKEIAEAPIAFAGAET